MGGGGGGILGEGISTFTFLKLVGLGLPLHAEQFDCGGKQHQNLYNRDPADPMYPLGGATHPVIVV